MTLNIVSLTFQKQALLHQAKPESDTILSAPEDLLIVIFHQDTGFFSLYNINCFAVQTLIKTKIISTDSILSIVLAVKSAPAYR